MLGNTRGKHSVRKGLVAGASGGLIGSWFMGQFQQLSNRLPQAAHSGGEGVSSVSAGGQSSQRQSEPATVKMATELARPGLGRDLTAEEKRIADPLMHYGFGVATGATYGMAVEVAPATAAAAGLPFGAAVWLLADEVAIPALGLAKSPRQNPTPTHAYALVSHLIYGFTAELSRRAVRRLL